MFQTKNNSGFTLVELIVVISLISIALFFSIPRFQDTLPTGHSKKVSRWIMAKVRVLKSAAVRDQKLYALNVNIDANKFWVTNESLTDEELQAAEQSGYKLPNDMNIVDLEFLQKGKISSGLAQILFYKNDYSDKVLIHIENSSNRRFSFLVEPFLAGVKYYERHVEFKD